jgi:Putative lumazine-binding
MKKIILVLGIILGTIALFAFNTQSKLEDEKKTIIATIERGYFNGAFNGLDTKSMAQTFHEDFAIYYAEGGDTLGKYPIKEWIAGVEKRKAAPTFDPNKKEWQGKCVMLDITGDAAFVKVELKKNGKQTYTDYLTLLKFKSGWRIVAKVYHDHTEK